MFAEGRITTATAKAAFAEEIASRQGRMAKLAIRPEHVIVKIGDQASFSSAGIDQHGHAIAF